MELKNLIKNRKVKFEFYRSGIMYYNVLTEDAIYRFPVPLNDIGEATLLNEDKAVLFMRWIRKAIDNDEIHTI